MTRREMREDTPPDTFGPRAERTTGAPRDYGEWSRRYLEHAPFAVAVVRGPEHVLVHANTEFRRLGALRNVAVGAAITGGSSVGTARELGALLDQVRRGGVVARAAMISPLRAGDAPWRFTVWPVPDRHGQVDQLVIVVLETEEPGGGRVTRARQTEIAERLLLSALREQMLAEEADASRRRSEFLAAASVRIGASLDRETTYATIAGLALPRQGSWCVVDIIEDSGSLRRLAIVHPDPAKQAIARELERVWVPEPGDSLGVPVVIHDPQPKVIDDHVDDALATSAHGPDTLHALQALGMGPLLVVPLVFRGTVGGAITFVSRPGDPPYLPEEVALASDLAAACASAIESARLYEVASTARAAAEAAQRDAEVANLAKSRFLSMMTHDLRTPLNAIGGYAQLLDLGIHGPVTAQQHTDLTRIKASQEHLLGLINKILSFAKLEAGTVHYAMEDVPLDESIRDVEVFIAPQLVQKKLQYRYEPAADTGGETVRVRADPEKLLQILVNLLSNAMKFTEPGGQIDVSCELPTDTVAALSVRDTGKGIPPHEMDSIFEPFVQVGRGLSTAAEGVGLGLAICRELARGMGGDLTAKSTVGEGSVFTLVLPRARSEGPA